MKDYTEDSLNMELNNILNAEQEISEKIKTLVKQKEDIKKQERKIQSKRNRLVLEKFRKHPELLTLLDHECASCSDENPCNGWFGKECRCRKCGLMELINDEYHFDDDNVPEINLSVAFFFPG